MIYNAQPGAATDNVLGQVLCLALADEPLFALPRLPFPISWRPTPPKEQVAPVLPARPLLLESKALPLQWLLDPEKDKNFPARVLARLIQSEAHEVNVWLRDDYRQSFITLSLALKGNTMPFVVASYQMYGLHPDKVWPARIARRKALLGPEYEAIAGEPALPLISVLPGSPKKPSSSEPLNKERAA